MSTFGQNLCRIRREKMIKQCELARGVGLTQTAISQFEKNLRMPKPVVMDKIAKFLGVENHIIFNAAEHEKELKDSTRLLKKLTTEQLKTVKDILRLVKDVCPNREHCGCSVSDDNELREIKKNVILQFSKCVGEDINVGTK